MNISETGENEGHKGLMCPFLGLKDDPTTAISFPSPANHCFHAKPALPVKLEFQGAYCLSGNHTTCEEFLRQPDTPLPPGLRFEPSSKLKKRSLKSSLWISLLALAVVVLVLWQLLSRGLLGGAKPSPVIGGMVTESSTMLGLQTLPVSPTQIQDTPTPTILMTATPTLPIQTATPTLKLPHTLETPIGLKYKLVIHRVLSGESLPSIASYYGTTIEAIEAVNYSLPIPLMVDWYVIIPPNQTDVDGLPAFTAYKVTTDVTVETLAQQLSIDPSLLKLYNGLNDGEILKTNEWVLVPYINTATP